MPVLVVVLVVVVAVRFRSPGNSGDDGWRGSWAISGAGAGAEGEQLGGSPSCGARGIVWNLNGVMASPRRVWNPHREQVSSLDESLVVDLLNLASLLLPFFEPQ